MTARNDFNEMIKKVAQHLHEEAEIFYQNNNLKDAYKIEKAVVILNPEEDLYLETVANYAFESKGCSNAVKYIKQAIAIQKSNTVFQDSLEEYQHGCS